ncbi:MAG: histidinol-phosphate transaminase [Candidatus Bathyarchaeia archaeon]
MSLRPRPEIESLVPSPHGGLNQAELKALGITPDEVLDFSVCSNPFPPPAEVRKAFDNIIVNRHPDSEATEFRECLSGKLGVSPDNILAGSGAVELIRLIALTYFGSRDSVLILEPTFGEYRVGCQIVGAEVVGQWGREEESYAHRIEETVDLIKRSQPRGIFICNPNNPTGRYLGRQEIEVVLDACRDTFLILDEAYISFVDESWSSLDLVNRGNLVIVRSMTKDYALGGLRLGYAIADKEIINALHLVRPPWNVNAVAQRAGIIALNHANYLERSKIEIGKAKQFLISELSRLDFSPIPSETNFFLVKVKNTKGFRTALLKQGLLVRDCTSFGLPEYVRIAARTIPECQSLIEAIEIDLVRLAVRKYT